MSYQYNYPRPAISIDIVVFRRTTYRQKVLLIKRLRPPYADQWALPGGFLEMDETLESAACRELLEETGLKCLSLRQLHAFSAVDRDPRQRVISVAFLAEISDDQMAIAADDAKEAQWFAIDRLPPLAFDHCQILDHAIEQNRQIFIA
jgi:8-oxo-dGTP diphosphatase